jgi:hypothetical protein
VGSRSPERKIEEPLSSSGRKRKKVLVRRAIVLRGVGKVAPVFKGSIDKGFPYAIAL